MNRTEKKLQIIAEVARGELEPLEGLSQIDTLYNQSDYLKMSQENNRNFGSKSVNQSSNLSEYLLSDEEIDKLLNKFLNDRSITDYTHPAVFWNRIVKAQVAKFLPVIRALFQKSHSHAPFGTRGYSVPKVPTSLSNQQLGVK